MNSEPEDILHSRATREEFFNIQSNSEKIASSREVVETCPSDEVSAANEDVDATFLSQLQIHNAIPNYTQAMSDVENRES